MKLTSQDANAIFLSLQAMIFFNTYYKHKTNAMKQYDLGKSLGRLPNFSKANGKTVLESLE